MANYKLSQDYWETSGIYDIGQGKTQRQINAEVAASTGKNDPTIVEKTATGSVGTFEGTEGVPLKGLLVNIDPVQSGSGDPSPTNVRPITGWTGANVMTAGKNLLPITAETTTISGATFTVNNDGSITVSGTPTETISSFNFGTVYLNEGTYYLSGINITDTGTSTTGRLVVNGVTATLSSPTVYVRDGTSKPFTVTKAGIVKVYPIIAASIASLLPLTYYPMITRASDTVYEPYQGTTYPITFPSEAGTVYGGTMDVTNGVLTVTDAYIESYNGETLPSTWISDRDVYAAGTTPTTGAQVVYKLSAPITYALTPTEVTTLLGLNNIWADTGDVNVTYGAYLTVVEDQLGEKVPKIAIAPIEKTTTASKAYSENELLIMDDTVYKVTSPISNGGTITVGTNVTATSIGELITALLNA